MKGDIFRLSIEKMSSDSSDEDNLELLKEAQDNQFINDSMFSEDPEKRAENKIEKTLPSLRTQKDEEEHFNFLKVTPQFRNHVAKKLSQILDAQLKELLTDVVEVDKTPKVKQTEGGVKLFAESEHFLIPTEEVLDVGREVAHSVNQRKLERYNKLKVKVSEEALKEVAVSCEDILSKREVKNWSNRSKAPVYQYKKTKNGKLVLIEPEFK